MGFDQIITKYSDPLPCDTCKYALDPVGKYSRSRNCLCKKYNTPENQKPNDVLFNNKECSYFEPEQQKAEDGGPGSGNFGHAGRPGYVGGSAPGTGGRQYRGGRSDVGYFGSRKDWLNGLQGEEQHKAVRMVAQAKRNIEDVLNFKKRLNDLKDRGLLTQEEVDERIEREKLDRYTENMTPEEFLMKIGRLNERKALLDLVGKSRSWKDRGFQLAKENLPKEELWALWTLSHSLEDRIGEKGKPFFSTEEAVNNDFDRAYYHMTEEEQEFYLDMKAKACGLPTSGKKIEDYSDEFQYSVGAKERPDKTYEKLDWDSEKIRGWTRDTHIPQMLQSALDMPKKATMTAEEIDDAWQEIINRASQGKLNERGYNLANELLTSYVAKVREVRWSDELKKALDGEKIESLTAEESKRIAEIIKKAAEGPFGTNFAHPEWYESDIMSDPDLKDQRAEYLLLKNKALGMQPPESKEVIEEKERKRREAEEAIRREFFEGDRLSTYESTDDVKKMAGTLGGTGVFSPGSPVDFAGCSPYNARMAAIRTEEFVKRFPFLFGNIGGIDNKQTGSGTYASCSRRSGGKVSLNVSSNFFGSREALERSYESDVKTGFHPKGTGADSVVTHELGHALGGFLTGKKVLGSDWGTEGRSFEGILRRRVLKSLKMVKANVASELSRYAEKDAYEWFAECIAEGLHSPSPRPMAAECMRQLDEILRQEGLIGG